MGVLSTDLLMVERSGTLHKAAVGDLPAPGKTAATLTHSGGAITLDVQAADVFRFEADEYFAAQTASYGGVSTQSTFGSSISLPAGMSEGDLCVVAVVNDSGSPVSTPAGWDKIMERTTGDPEYAVFAKIMGSTPDPSFDSGLTACYMQAFFVSGADPTAFLNAISNEQIGYSAAGSGCTVTTTVDGCLIIFLHTINNSSYSVNQTPAEFTDIGNGGNAGAGVSGRVSRASQASAGAFSPSSHFVASGGSVGYARGFAITPQAGSGERDYTFNLSNIPASGLEQGLIDIELKTDTGSVAFAGGTISWRGAVPSFDEVGRYVIAFWADSTGITLLDLTAAVSAGGAMSGAAIVSAINAELGGSTWQGGAGGGVALWKAKGNNQGNNYANTSADVGWNAWAIDGGSDLTLSGAQITAVTAGTYLFAVTVRANGDNRVELRIQAHRDTGSGFSALADEIVDDYIMRDTDQDRGAVTLHCALELSAGDKIKFVAEGNVDGACTGLAAGTSLIAQKVA